VKSLIAEIAAQNQPAKVFKGQYTKTTKETLRAILMDDIDTDYLRINQML
jgi:hypothetical protein